ncbi:MAG: tRNA adenosine(34) deaminase TadA [Ghiorsea sp.]
MNDEDYMRLALAQAEIAASLGEVPVGAVLVTACGKVFQAHNAPIMKHDASAHAEIEVMRLASLDLGNYRLSNSRLFVTLEPCLMCAGAMLHARIGQLIYAAAEPKTGAVTSLYHVFSDTRLNHQIQLISGVLADESALLLRNFFKSRREDKAQKKKNRLPI